jgi:hypothetical protein
VGRSISRKHEGFGSRRLDQPLPLLLFLPAV